MKTYSAVTGEQGIKVVVVCSAGGVRIQKKYSVLVLTDNTLRYKISAISAD
jgi:hypothetical protein